MTQVLDPAGSPSTPKDYPAIELWRRGMLDVRHRLNRTSNNATQVATRAANTFRHMGDDLLREGGFGETIGARAGSPPNSGAVAQFKAVAQAVADVGWKVSTIPTSSRRSTLISARYRRLLRRSVELGFN